MLSKTNQPFRNHQVPKTFPHNRLLRSPNRNFSPQHKETPQHDPYMVCVRNVWLLDRKTAQNEESRRSIDKKIKVPLLIIGYQNGQHRPKLTSRRSLVHTCSVTYTQGIGPTGTRSVTYPQIVGHTGAGPGDPRRSGAIRACGADCGRPCARVTYYLWVCDRLRARGTCSLCVCDRACVHLRPSGS